MTRWIQLGVLAATAAFACGSAYPALAAQYKWVGPDGRINYSDVAPPVEAQVIKGPGSAASAPVGDPSLPYGLRITANKYPVNLYVTKNCDPCRQARELLVKRGVPFSELLLSTNRDVDAFKKQGFDGQTLPALKVGSQTMSGFEAGQYNVLLDAAGYPKSSALPSHYVRASARALTADEPAAPPSAGDDGGNAGGKNGDGSNGARPGAGQASAANRAASPQAPATLPTRPAAIGADPNFRF